MSKLRMPQEGKRRFLKNKKDILTQTSICLILIVISVTVRIALKGWFYANFNAIPYISDEGYYWEIYQDAKDYYQHFTYAFMNDLWNPYADTNTMPLLGYVYGPIFIYGLSFVNLFVNLFTPGTHQVFHSQIYTNQQPIIFGYQGLENAWISVTIAPLIFDTITTIFIYLILLKKKVDNKRNLLNMVFAGLASIAYVFMPLVLFYNDFVYLNSYMFTTYTVISLYFMSRKKSKLSAVFITLAILTKLNALFLIPLWFVFILRNDRKGGFHFLITVFVAYFIFSIPWIFMSPSGYFEAQLWPGNPFNTHFGIEPQWILWSTTPFHAFLYWGWDNLGWFYYQINNFFLPLLIFVFICCLSVILIGPHMRENNTAFFTYQAMFVIGSHIFLSRGNYKYYDSFFIPFVLIAVASWVEDLEVKLFEFIKKNKKLLRIKKEIESTNKLLIILKISSIVIFLGILGWIFVLNFWIIIKIKWLHSFYTFLLFVTIILLFDKKLHLILWRKKNYVELQQYIREQIQEIRKEVINFLRRIKRTEFRKRGK